jgi:hypothetical protein
MGFHGMQLFGLAVIGYAIVLGLTLPNASSPTVVGVGEFGIALALVGVLLDPLVEGFLRRLKKERAPGSGENH